MKFKGSIDELKRLVKDAGFKGWWCGDVSKNQFRFESCDGRIIRWWESTGTLQTQGLNAVDTETKLFEAL